MGHAWVLTHTGAGPGMTPGLAAAMTAAGMLMLFVFVWTMWWAIRGGQAHEPASTTVGLDVARRCAIGCANWPDHSDYSECLVCGEPTTRIFETPMDSAEALGRKRRADFERQYGPAEVI